MNLCSDSDKSGTPVRKRATIQNTCIDSYIYIYIIIYVAGTFAVVSLMVGSVVDKGLEAKGILNSLNATSESSSKPYQPGGDSAEILQTKLALAMGVTFAVGCVQVGWDGDVVTATPWS